MSDERIRITPEICTYSDDNNSNLKVEISIPGVKKEDINLRMQDDSIAVNALRADIEYATAFTLCCPVKAAEAKAKYDNGLLRIEVPYKDVFESAVKINIE